MKVALAGDAMLGRKVGERIAGGAGAGGMGAAAADLVSDEVRSAIAEADACVVNLECCISGRGEPNPSPDRATCLRAPPAAAEVLAELGVTCVTLANNHALDHGPEALLDTFRHLGGAGVRWVGAGPDLAAARAPAVLTGAWGRLTVVALCDHAAADAATPDRPGVAHAPLDGPEPPPWLLDTVATAAAPAAPRLAGDGDEAGDAVEVREAPVVIVAPHWGPHMATEPSPRRRAMAASLRRAGASLVAGHSAHLCQGVEGPVLYDMGDLVNDYATHIRLRNDLSLLFLVTFDGAGRAVELEALPLQVTPCHTRLATGRDLAWMRRRFRTACRALGTEVGERDGRLVVSWQG